ncbi:MAG: hypothetical protein ACRDTH_01655 [Pseudonocardiaceae bacterium]
MVGDYSYIWPRSLPPHGTLVARHRSDSSIILVDLDTGAIVSAIAASITVPGRRTGIAFSSDGTQLITVTEGVDTNQGLVVHRDISDDALISAACATAGRDLTAAEWQTLVGADIPDNLRCR